MVDFNPASRNTASDFSLPGSMALVLDKFAAGLHDCLPAAVVSYNRATNRARVQPLISLVTTQDKIVPRSPVASVPVFQYGGGGFVMSFPVRAGDTGWIKANDRDISLFMQSGVMSPPNTQRKHSFSDAMFFPDTMLKAFTVAAEDANNAVFQNADGSVKISLWSNLIKIMATNGVGIGGTPNAHSILDLQSTTKAFLPPRMTTIQRDAIPSPQEGMIIWNLDTHALSTYANGAWT